MCCSPRKTRARASSLRVACSLWTKRRARLVQSCGCIPSDSQRLLHLFAGRLVLHLQRLRSSFGWPLTQSVARSVDFNPQARGSGSPSWHGKAPEDVEGEITEVDESFDGVVQLKLANAQGNDKLRNPDAVIKTKALSSSVLLLRWMPPTSALPVTCYDVDIEADGFIHELTAWTSKWQWLTALSRAVAPAAAPDATPAADDDPIEVVKGATLAKHVAFEHNANGSVEARVKGLHESAHRKAEVTYRWRVRAVLAPPVGAVVASEWSVWEKVTTPKPVHIPKIILRVPQPPKPELQLLRSLNSTAIEMRWVITPKKGALTVGLTARVRLVREGARTARSFLRSHHPPPAETLCGPQAGAPDELEDFHTHHKGDLVLAINPQGGKSPPEGSTEVEGRVAGATYRVAVQTVSKSGRASEWSNELVVTMPFVHQPEAPQLQLRFKEDKEELVVTEWSNELVITMPVVRRPEAPQQLRFKEDQEEPVVAQQPATMWGDSGAEDEVVATWLRPGAPAG